jgi:predicted negative regulator of RcsB-dependent stress response
MSAQSVAPRSRQSRPVDSDDVVLTRAIEFTNWARANIRIIVVVAVLLTVLVAGLLIWRAQRAERLERAAMEFQMVEQQVATGNLPVVQQELARYVNRFSGTTYADEAALLLAQLQLQQGNAAEAIEVLREPASRIRRGTMGAQAALLLAAAQQATGDDAAAEATYLRVADESPMTFRRQEALNAAAALREESGNYAGAAELYGRLAQMAEPGSMDRSVYEMRQAEASALASQAATNQ